MPSGDSGVPYTLRPNQPTTGVLVEGTDVEISLKTSFTSQEEEEEATLEVSLDCARETSGWELCMDSSVVLVRSLHFSYSWFSYSMQSPSPYWL